MKATENYNIPLYEPNDLANLCDGYNRGAEIIDSAMKANSDKVDTYDAAIQKNANDIQKNANDIQKNANDIQKNANDIATETARAKAAENELTTGVSGVVKSVAELKNDLSCYINVSAYGISTDNADNTAAFQNAVNDTASKGLVLYVPNGTYKLSKHISLPWNVCIVGQSTAGTVLKFTSSTGLIADVVDKNGYKTCVGCTIKNITVEGSYSEYNVLPTDSKSWYSERYHDSYMAYNQAGIGGWFTMCEISHVCVRNWVYGICTTQAVQPPSYNNLYNNIYGDLRTFDYIDAYYCHTGIWMGEWDTMLDHFDVHMCYYIDGPVRYYGGFVSNGHIWGINEPPYFLDCFVNNLEIEAISSTTTSDGERQFDGMIRLKATSSAVVVRGLRLWNLISIPETTKYNHPLIREEDSTAPITIIGATIGTNSSYTTPSELPVQVLSAKSPSGTTLIGTLDPSIKTIKGQDTTGYAFAGNSPVYALLTSENDNMPKGIQHIKGFSNITLTHLS